MLGLSAIAGAFAGAALVLALVGLTCFTGDDGRARTIYATSSICALAALGAVAFIVDLRRRTPG
ncbi:hypothetical protein [Frondihabitans australicus]|nr:hypothetical protein [Frondihabitans australicus]